jgi:Tannase and feruloyl esterase
MIERNDDLFTWRYRVFNDQHRAMSRYLRCAVAVAIGICGQTQMTNAQQSPAVASSATAVDEKCTKLKELQIDQVAIESANLQPAKLPVAGANYPSMTGVPGTGPQLSGLPAFCRVIGSIHPEAGSNIRFEVWLPQQDWDGRFNGANSGGLAGYINYNDLSAAIRAGQAVAGSDTGHVGAPADGTWAKGHPEKVRDYGWRAVHLTTVVGKKFVTEYYGSGPRHSYFIGCSNGGRQALIEAARFPEDYDGIVAGAPASSWTGIAATMINTIQAQSAPDAALRAEQIALLQSEVIKQCDANDGQVDGLIADPRQCKFDASKLACGVSDSPQCFSKAQVTAVTRIHNGVRDKNGKLIAYGFPPSGAEVGNPVKAFGWDGNIVAKFQPVTSDKTFSNSLLNDLAPTPIATDETFDFTRDLPRVKKVLAADLDAQPDLSKFFARGGKLIMWHGWADPILPPEPSVAFYEAAVRKSGTKATENMKLFMVPGVQHCVGGTGPDALGQIGAPMPGEQPERSVGAAIQAWVESARVPDTIVARRGMIQSMMKPAATERQRLLCAYPKKAVLKANADPDQASSYECRP